MGIEYQVLGKPFCDNALWVRVNSGQNIHRLLFDCGESVLNGLGNTEIQNIDHLFFSHCHIDHIAGFDSFCRLNYNRFEKPVSVWGPEDIKKIIFHRLQGFTWNLIYGQPGKWQIREIREKEIVESFYYANDAFCTEHTGNNFFWNKKILTTPDYEVFAIILNHSIPSIGYIVRESQRWNIDKDILKELHLPSGPWLHTLKDQTNPDEHTIMLENSSYSLGELRQKLLKSSLGDTIVYLSDFVWEEKLQDMLGEIIPEQATIVCESQYKHSDLEFAKKNYHLTNIYAGQLAQKMVAKKLILLHISQRYLFTDLVEILNECRTIFPETYFPDEWHIAKHR